MTRFSRVMFNWKDALTLHNKTLLKFCLRANIVLLYHFVVNIIKLSFLFHVFYYNLINGISNYSVRNLI